MIPIVRSPHDWWSKQTREERCLTAVALALGLTAAAYLCWHFHLGAGMADESSYLALAYRFFLGDRPFLDEVSVTQTAVLLSYPFLKPYMSLHGGTEGLLLYSRFVYLVLSVGMAVVVVYGFCRRLVAIPVALLLALVSFLDIPVGIANLSYNSIVYWGWLGAVLLSARAVDPLRPRLLVPVSLFHGVAVLAYPPILPACVAHDLVIFYLCRGRRLTVTLRLVLPPILLGVAVMLLYGIHPSDVWEGQRAALNMLENQGYVLGPSKLFRVLGDLIPPLWPVIAGTAGLAFFGVRKWPARTVALLAVAFVPVLYLVVRGPSGGLGLPMICIYVGLLCPCFWALGREKETRDLLLLVWLPSIPAAGVFSWASFNGITQAGLGLAPAFYLSLSFLYRALNRSYPVSESVWHGGLVLVSLTGLMVLPIYSMRRSFENPGGIKGLTSRFTEGPYKGIFAAERDYDFFSLLARELPSVEKAGGKILFYPIYPPGYLFSRLRPAGEMVWATRMDVKEAGCYRYVREFDENHVAVKISLGAAGEMDRNLGESPLEIFLRAKQFEKQISPRVTFFYGLRPGQSPSAQSP